ncbi:MAG: DUF1636 family protein, partial [Halocynthiibacter sp.]
AASGALTDGETLAALIEANVKAETCDTIKTRRVSCLMGCTRSCNVTVQGAGKLNYTLGNFTPDAEAAEAIHSYARLHAQSETGLVPYRQWPSAIKGHFMARHLPIPADE